MHEFKKNLKWHVGIFFLFFTFLIWYVVWAEESRHLLKIAFLDVGQGDAIYIESPTGHQMLVDGGPPGRVLSALGQVLPFYDNSIDVLLVTNPDQDHMAGFIEILQNYEVGKIIEPGTYSPTKTYAELESLVFEKGVERVLAKAPMMIDFGDGVKLEILFPDQDVSDWKTNDGSIVARLTYGKSSVILQGDAPKKTERHLLGTLGSPPAGGLKSDILKVGHHGSKTSTLLEYVSVISPYYAVISSGANNKYGHPHKETLDTLNQLGIKILRTDQLGSIIFESDGEKLEFKN